MDVSADKCLYIEDKQYGCLITSNLYCDNELYYQLVSAQIDSSGFVLAAGIFEVGYLYQQCFGDAEDNKYICLEFGAGSSGSNYMSVGYVTLEVHENGQVQIYRYDQEVQFYSDAVCGDSLYNNPPCNIYAELEAGILTDYPHTVPNNYQSLNAYLASPQTMTPYLLAVGDNNCVYAGPAGVIADNALPLYCPDIWYKPCIEWPTFKTRAGLYFEAAFGTGFYCGALPNGQICVSTEQYSISLPGSVEQEVEARFSVYLMDNSFAVFDQIELSFSQSFPTCGYSLEYSCQSAFDPVFSYSVQVQPVHHGHDDDDDDHHDQHHSDSHHEEHNEHHSDSHHSESKHHSKHDSSVNVAAIVVPVIAGSVFLLGVAIAAVVLGVYFYRKRTSSQSKVYSLMVQ